jgi:hypothetical protein
MGDDMGIISGILKSLFSNKKRKKHGFHVSCHIDDDDEELSDEGDDSDSGDYGGDSGDGGDGGD